MQEELQAIKDAQDSGDHHQAVILSDAYVAANPNAFVDMIAMPLTGEGGLVAAIDTFRAAGMETNLWQVQAWIYHKFEPQKIGGTTEPTVRVADNG